MRRMYLRNFIKVGWEDPIEAQDRDLGHELLAEEADPPGGRGCWLAQWDCWNIKVVSGYSLSRRGFRAGVALFNSTLAWACSGH